LSRRRESGGSRSDRANRIRCRTNSWEAAGVPASRLSPRSSLLVRIAYFTESMYPLVDGVSRTLARLFDSLERQGVEFRVYSPFVPETPVPWGRRLRRMPFARFPLYTDYRVSYPPRGLAREVEAYAPDLVHVVSPTPVAVWAQRWARRHGVPAVASFHTHFVSYFRYYGVPRLEGLGWRMLRRFYARCERIYAPTRRIIRELEEHGIGNLELWSRGIDLHRFGPEYRDPALRKRVGADDRTPMLLLVSRLVREKDLLDLVPMQGILRESGTRFRLVLVGDGPLRGELEAAMPDAHFAGHQVGEALSRWYASADVFVFPSTTETFGNVVAEAQASGVPPVVVDRGGPPELIEPGVTGQVARANDPADLAARVGHLLRDADARQRMGEAARQAVAERDWEAINGRLIGSYAAVIDRFRSRHPAP
jgi:phosphatidylinositol alpha 1,6-mannosyltransferase